MKLKMHYGLAVAALLLAGTGLSNAQLLITNVINAFDTTPTSGNAIGREWGPGSWAWDAANGNPGGAAYYTASWDASSDTPLVAFACETNGNPWYVGTPINCSRYQTLEFDIKWDNTSDITIDQFNNVQTWPFSLTNNASAGASVFQSYATTGGAALVAHGNINGLEIDLCGGAGGQQAPVIVNTNIPAAASNGWVHMVIPINQSQANIDGVSGIVFHKWTKDTWTLATPVNARFWIDNLMLKGTAAPTPPPTVSAPTTKATQGLNVFASTSGPYDRQEAVLRQTSGLSWVGMATPANPVSYSFTIAGYPNSPDCEAYMFLVPNPAYLDGAPDWNETNCALAYIQGNASSATMHFRYKVNEDHQQAMYSGGSETRTDLTTTNNFYYTAAPGTLPGGPITTVVSPGIYNITNESGNLGSVTNNGVLGTWTIKFTSDTNVTLIAPNGNTSTCSNIPPYNVGNFAEQASPGFYVYLGMQANNANAKNQAVVYSHFAISNTASPFSEDFLADSVLDTTNTWNTSPASGPKGVLIVPAGLAYWISWTLPDSGFSLQTSSTLNNPLAWTSPTTGPIIGMAGVRSQLLASNEIPAGNMVFFRLIKRSFTQLQVLLPGETNAPNTLTGKTGTPTAATSGGAPVTVTVNAVDATWNNVNVSGDNIHLSSITDGGVIVPNDSALAGGTMTGSVQFNTAGSQTVTATDTSNTNIISNTSSPITVN